MSVLEKKRAVARAEKALKQALRELAQSEAAAEEALRRKRIRQKATEYVLRADFEELKLWYQCTRKPAYIFKKDAEARHVFDKGLTAYLCNECTGWHNGHGSGASRVTQRKIVNVLVNYEMSGKIFI